MRILATIPAALLALPAFAADLPRPLVEQPVVVAPPVVVEGPSDVCFTGSPVEVFRAPGSASDGVLPAGMTVVVLDSPWSRSEDLWVRIRPPRENQYYGWVYTRDLICH